MKSKKIKSPVRWVGGKSKSVDYLLDLFPEHYTYVEPFFGGGWLYFNKEKAKIEIINDANNELMNFYSVLLNNYDEFYNKFKYLIPSRAVFNEFKSKIDTLNNVDRAVEFYYINRTCFGGAMDNPSLGTSNIRRSNLCTITDDLDKILLPIHNRMKDTFVESLDYKEIFKRYDKNPNTKEQREIFFFVDPPYKDTRGYSDKFGRKEHIELFEILKNIKGKFLLTINDDEEVLDWYKDFNIISNDVMYKLCKDTKGIGNRKELIITNYEITH